MKVVGIFRGTGNRDSFVWRLSFYLNANSTDPKARRVGNDGVTMHKLAFFQIFSPFVKSGFKKTKTKSIIKKTITDYRKINYSIRDSTFLPYPTPVCLRGRLSHRKSFG